MQSDFIRRSAPHFGRIASIALLTALAILLPAAIAPAAAITYSGSGTFPGNGHTLSASATFDTLGNSLIVTLTNTGVADVLEQPEILCAVFYEVNGGLLGLTPGTGSAVLTSGSSVLFGGSDPGGVVGGEWAYMEGIGGVSPNGGRYGISSSGYGIFGSGSFPGTDLDPPGSVNGVNYGVTSSTDNPATGQPAVTGSNPLIKNSVTFTIPGLPTGFDPMASIGNVFFQYGTALVPTDPGFSGSPEPATLSLLGLGLLAIRRRR
ncbi:MAG: PEP-CTERM sorting domain-containing protein [Phycisphaerae bacterium]